MEWEPVSREVWESARSVCGCVHSLDEGSSAAGFLHCGDRRVGKRRDAGVRSTAPGLACLRGVGEEPQSVERAEGRFLWLISGWQGQRPPPALVEPPGPQCSVKGTLPPSQGPTCETGRYRNVPVWVTSPL